VDGMRLLTATGFKADFGERAPIAKKVGCAFAKSESLVTGPPSRTAKSQGVVGTVLRATNALRVAVIHCDGLQCDYGTGEDRARLREGAVAKTGILTKPADNQNYGRAYRVRIARPEGIAPAVHRLYRITEFRQGRG